MMGPSYFEWLGQAPPVEQVNHLISGGWVAQAIGVAAEFGIADLLVDGPGRIWIKVSRRLPQCGR